MRGLLGSQATYLEQNFRSQVPVLAWVNELFQNWMGDGDGKLQARYLPLTGRWEPPEAEPPRGVHCLGGGRACKETAPPYVGRAL